MTEERTLKNEIDKIRCCHNRLELAEHIVRLNTNSSRFWPAKSCLQIHWAVRRRRKELERMEENDRADPLRVRR